MHTGEYGKDIGAYVIDEVSGEPRLADTREEWTEFMEREGARRVACDTIDTMSEPVRVSTVFLGLDYGFHRDAPRELFETMIFGGKHNNYMERYPTKADALEGHSRALLLAKE